MNPETCLSSPPEGRLAANRSPLNVVFSKEPLYFYQQDPVCPSQNSGNSTGGFMTGQGKPSGSRRHAVPILLILFLLLLSLACSVLGANPTETPTASPTDTPEPPTSTPKPTNTPKPTADIAGTQAARVRKTEQARQEAEEYMLSRISANLSDAGLEPGDGRIVFFRPEEYQIQSSAYNTIRWSSIEDSFVGDFAMYSDVTWESEMGFAGCGYVFRLGEDTKVDPWYNLIINRLEGLPYAFFDVWVGDYVIAESEFYYSNAIRYGQGDSNEVLLTGRKNEMSIYVNGKKIGVWWNAKQTSGRMGFAVFANSGLTTCKFTDSWIWEWTD
jgi:hypothetical protein